MNTYEIRQYTDDEGKLVTARISVEGNTLDALIDPATFKKVVKFFGTYTVPHPQLGAMRMEFEFPEGWELSKCFENFKKEAENHFNKLQEEAQKEAAAPKIWTPGEARGKGGLLVPK